jgi:AAA domain
VIPDSFWIDEFPVRNQEWLIEELLSPHINILSGQPKVGKSTLATAIALAIINGEPILGKRTQKMGPVGWIGFDSGWSQELRSRVGLSAKNQILMQKPFDLTKKEFAREFGQRLVNFGCQLLVVDHLYGFANEHNLDINNQRDAAIALGGIQTINSEFEIPVLLLAQAPKGYGGGAAHSNFIRSIARVLLELTGESKNGRRKLRLVGNELETEDIRLSLSDTELISLEQENKKERVRDRDFSTMEERASQAFLEAGPGDLETLSSFGRLLYRLKFCSSPEAGRTMASRYEKVGILAKSSSGITKGPNLVT